jgi:hypothetical protein
MFLVDNILFLAERRWTSIVKALLVGELTSRFCFDYLSCKFKLLNIFLVISEYQYR